MRNMLLAVALLGALAPIPAVAADHDGNWKVTIVTEKGGCDRAYGYEVAVSQGQLRYVGGNGGFNFTGSVSPSGVVKVSVSSGSKRADGSGHLAANGGHGTWRGQECAGYWEAERR